MRVLAITLFIVSAVAENRTIVVTGATGRSGSLFYHRLKKENLWNVRALVRNVTKAKSILGCSACDESEGVFVGDVTEPTSLGPVMKGADTLAIFTASITHCTGIPFGPFGHCSFPKGAEPKDIDFMGTKVQVAAFAEAGGSLNSKQIIYMSTMMTTMPDNFLDRLGNGHAIFYHLQAEAFIMDSGIPYTIAKPCGLSDGEGGKNELVVGHDDATFTYIHTVKRDDVARVLVEAVRNPAAAAGLRFDICANYLGSPTKDIINEVFKPARYPWEAPSVSSAAVVV